MMMLYDGVLKGEIGEKNKGKDVLNKALFIFSEKNKKNKIYKKLETENNNIVLAKVWKLLKNMRSRTFISQNE